MASRSVFVVGGTGYIGTHVVRELVRTASPWHTVQVLTRSAASAAKASALGAEPVMGDLSEPGAWCDAVRTAGFVVHCAQPAPRTEALRTTMSPMAAAYLCANMPHSNARLKRLGFELQYPRIEQGIASLDLKQRGS